MVFNTVAESVTAVIGGHIDIVAATPSTVLAQVQSGRLRVLGITAPQRVPGLFAQYPTWREQGIDSIASFWHAVVGPAGMTPAQVQYWEEQLAALAATDLPGSKLIMPWKGVKFDATGQNTLGQGILVQIIDGKYNTVWPFASASREVVWPMPKWDQRK